MLQNRVKSIRAAAGLSQIKLACKAGIAASTLCAIETGKLAPWPKVRKALSKVLGVNETDLFPKEKDSAESLAAPAESANQSTNEGDFTHGYQS